MRKIAFLFFLPWLMACQAQTKELNPRNKFSQQFKDYWFAGNAEITSYDLKQARYGEMRHGEAVLVFVTEDFLVEKQVKKESLTTDKAAAVLKLNLIRKFPTGIYDYSMMNSTFTPINQQEITLPLKSTTSAQEWCGHSWLQLNLQNNNKYKVQSYSYFEAEGDAEVEVKDAILEDQLFSQIRINPNALKEGEQKVFPSAHYLRFAHQPLKAVKAIVKKVNSADERFNGKSVVSLTVSYPTLSREVEIAYEKEFPHEILGWKEVTNSKGKKMETIAVVKAELKTPYWNQNSVKDSVYRNSLLLR